MPDIFLTDRNVVFIRDVFVPSVLGAKRKSEGLDTTLEHSKRVYDLIGQFGLHLLGNYRQINRALMVAMLHDAIEDTCPTMKEKEKLGAEIYNKCGINIYRDVFNLTELLEESDGIGGVNWIKNKRKYLKRLSLPISDDPGDISIISCAVAACDKIDNLRYWRRIYRNDGKKMPRAKYIFYDLVYRRLRGKTGFESGSRIVDVYAAELYELVSLQYDLLCTPNNGIDYYSLLTTA